jgi:hypothetical protein
MTQLVGKKMQVELSSEPAVLKLDSVIHKEARTVDGKPLGYITVADEQAIYVLSSSFKEYRIPKSQVRGFKGSMVIITLEFREAARYKIG